MSPATGADALTQALAGTQKVFLDSAVVIYYVEQHPIYAPLLQRLFEQIGEGNILAVCSAVTLAECLVAPLRLNDRDTYREFVDVILNARNTIFVPIDAEVAQRAAELRVQYNLTLTDAFQVAAALSENCDVFLTNDRDLKRVNEITVLVLSDLVSNSL